MDWIGHEEFPTRFDVDMETQMLGSVKPYHRQVYRSFISIIVKVLPTNPPHRS